MESFYGGRQGTSIVIKGSFKYITDEYVLDERGNKKYKDPYYGEALKAVNKMPDDTGESTAKKDALDALQKSTMTIQLGKTDYKDVWYNEYCIIDHPNRNNLNNGQLFRRTLKNESDNKLIGGVAEYVGQITGPAGSSPQLVDLNGVEELQTKFNAIAKKLGPNDVLQYVDADGNPVTYDPSSTNPSLGLLNFGTNIKYIPGNFSEDGGETYIESGTYGWFNIRQGTDEADTSKIYLGFDIPYQVNTFSAGDRLRYTDPPSITRRKRGAFYDHWEINIPRGAPGGYFGNLEKRTHPGGEQNNYYLPTDISYNVNTNNYEYSRNSAAEAYKWNQEGQIGYFATFYWYGDIENNDGGIKQIPNIFLGLARGISSINLSNDGQITIYYEDNTTNTLNALNPITWIVNTKISTTSAGGLGNHLLVQFNNVRSDLTKRLEPEQKIALGLNVNDCWYDLGVVRETAEGLYVETNIAIAPQSENNIISKANEELNNAENVDTHKIYIINVTLNNETTPYLFYYNTSITPHAWDILGTTGGSGGASKGAILEPWTGENIPQGALILETKAITSSDSLTTPWRKRS